MPGPYAATDRARNSDGDRKPSAPWSSALAALATVAARLPGPPPVSYRQSAAPGQPARASNAAPRHIGWLVALVPGRMIVMTVPAARGGDHSTVTLLARFRGLS